MAVWAKPFQGVCNLLFFHLVSAFSPQVIMPEPEAGNDDQTGQDSSFQALSQNIHSIFVHNT